MIEDYTPFIEKRARTLETKQLLEHINSSNVRAVIKILKNPVNIKAEEGELFQYAVAHSPLTALIMLLVGGMVPSKNKHVHSVIDFKTYKSLFNSCAKNVGTKVTQEARYALIELLLLNNDLDTAPNDPNRGVDWQGFRQVCSPPRMAAHNNNIRLLELLSRYDFNFFFRLKVTQKASVYCHKIQGEQLKKLIKSNNQQEAINAMRTIPARVLSNIVDGTKYTPSMLAAMTGHVGMQCAFMNNHNIEMVKESFKNDQHVPKRNLHLLHVDIKQQEYHTLHDAIKAQDPKAFYQMLMVDPSQLGAKNSQGRTPLDIAISVKSIVCIVTLVQVGADISGFKPYKITDGRNQVLEFIINNVFEAAKGKVDMLSTSDNVKDDVTEVVEDYCPGGHHPSGQPMSQSMSIPTSEDLIQHHEIQPTKASSWSSYLGFY